MTDLHVHSLADRPDLVAPFWRVDGAWPTFMQQSPVGAQHYASAVVRFPDLHFVGVDDTGTVIARVHAVPVEWPGVTALPARGWDWALESSSSLVDHDRAAVSLIEARIDPQYRGRSLSTRLLGAVREHLQAAGTRHLVGPVRPTGKSAEPFSAAVEYAGRRRPDGLPVDGWLRVHVRLGGRIVSVAPLSMTIPGTLAQWRDWTGLPFDTDGPTVVPGGLAPVLVSTAQDGAVYLEPNVWVYHRLGGPETGA